MTTQQAVWHRSIRAVKVTLSGHAVAGLGYPAVTRRRPSTLMEGLMPTRSTRRGSFTLSASGAAGGARVTAVASSVLSTGVFFGTVASLTPSKRRFDSHTYVTVQQATIRNLRPVMGVLLPVSVLANLAVLATVDRTDRAARRNAVAALVGPLASLLLTAVWELPINARVMTWHPDHPPTDWAGDRNRWEIVHLARAATALLGLAGTLATTMRPHR